MWARGDCVRHGGEGFDPVLPCGGQDVGAVIARMYLATGLNIKMGRIQTLRKKQNHIPFPLLLFTTIAQKKKWCGFTSFGNKPLFSSKNAI